MTRHAIDLTPTWSDTVGLLVALIEGSNAKGRATAIAELQRMAALADKYVESQK
jgi:hypothetical protein